MRSQLLCINRSSCGFDVAATVVSLFDPVECNAVLTDFLAKQVSIFILAGPTLHHFFASAVSSWFSIYYLKSPR